MALMSCSECKKEVSDQATSCPHCGNPIHFNKFPVSSVQETGKGKHKRLIILLLIFLAGVVYVWQSGMLQELTQLREGTTIEKGLRPEVHRQVEETRPEPPPGTFYFEQKQIGQEFIVNNVEYAVESGINLGSVLTRNKDGSGGFGYSDGGTFVLVKFTAKNIGSNEVSLQNVAIRLIDSEKRNYQLSDQLDLILYKVPDYSLLDQFSWQPTTIKPGFEKRLFVIAEVALGAEGVGVLIGNQSDQNYLVSLSL